jgi:hypothetical protein
VLFRLTAYKPQAVEPSQQKGMTVNGISKLPFAFSGPNKINNNKEQPTNGEVGNKIAWIISERDICFCEKAERNYTTEPAVQQGMDVGFLATDSILCLASVRQK